MTLDVNVSFPEDLMRQATMTAEAYMQNGKRCIEELFGEPYARMHPELLGAFMQAAALDFHTAMMKVAAQDIRDAIQSAL